MKEISGQAQFAARSKNTPEENPAAIQNLALGEHASLISGRTFPDSIFLSCDMSAAVAGHIVKSGGVVIPNFKGFFSSSSKVTLMSCRSFRWVRCR